MDDDKDYTATSGVAKANVMNKSQIRFKSVNRQVSDALMREFGEETNLGPYTTNVTNALNTPRNITPQLSPNQSPTRAIANGINFYQTENRPDRRANTQMKLSERSNGSGNKQQFALNGNGSSQKH